MRTRTKSIRPCASAVEVASSALGKLLDSLIIEATSQAIRY